MMPRVDTGLRVAGLVLLAWLGYHAVSLTRVLPLDVYDCGEWRGPELATFIVVLDLPLLLAGLLLLLGVRRPWAYLPTPLAIGLVYLTPQFLYYRLVGLVAVPCAIGPRWEWLIPLGAGIDLAVAALCLALAARYWRAARLRMSR